MKELINLRRERLYKRIGENPVAAGIKFSAVFLCVFKKKYNKYFAYIKNVYIFAVLKRCGDFRKTLKAKKNDTD